MTNIVRWVASAPALPLQRKFKKNERKKMRETKKKKKLKKIEEKYKVIVCRPLLVPSAFL